MEEFKEIHDIRLGNPNSYRLGYRRCTECEYYIKGETHCPCCRDYLRTKPRNNISKRLYNNLRGSKQ